MRNLSSQHNLIFHLDGARLFNAATALKVPPAEISQYCDSVSTAFSKVSQISEVIFLRSDTAHKAPTTLNFLSFFMGNLFSAVLKYISVSASKSLLSDIFDVRLN